MAHSSIVLAQMLKLLPRHEFETLAEAHHQGRKLRKISRWAQFVAMTSAQLTGRASLRDLLGNLAAQSSKLYHLGVGLISRSSLARTNEKQPWTLYGAERVNDFPTGWWIFLCNNLGQLGADRCW